MVGMIMIFISIGCLAFIFLYIFDFNKIIFVHRNINICFAVGLLLLAFSTMGILLGNFESFEVTLPFRLLFGVLSIISLLLLVYSLFFWLPFGGTYIEVKKDNTVVDTGMYALCRHPGAIWVFSFYLFLWLASGKMMMLWAGIIWTVMNTILVYVEDRWIFPKILNGYDHYKTTVPFLIPSLTGCKKNILFYLRKIQEKV
jgi:protein-S-isoprenylcysteine O-methyltransferase Ste14